MRIAFITTVRHNVGDDFVRLGLQFILKKALKGRDISFSAVHKHAPITSRIGFSRLRKLRAWDDHLPLPFTGDRILQADWVIQSGAPVYWCHESVGAHCCDNEWYEPLVRRRLYGSGKPLFNIAGGSCQTYHSDGSEVCARCRAYIREFFDACRLTTLRDELAAAILKSAGRAASILPCTSLFAVDETPPADCAAEDYVVVNFMPNAGHYTFGQVIDRRRWFAQFAALYGILKKSERLVFSCHSEEEKRWAKRIDPAAEVFIAFGRAERYIKFYACAKAGIFSRIHGAFVSAALGKPCLTIGVDSRTRMLKEIGLPTLFVNDAAAEEMADMFHDLLNERRVFAEKMRIVKRKALERYVELFS